MQRFTYPDIKMILEPQILAQPWFLAPPLHPGNLQIPVQEIVDNELVPALRGCQQVLSDPVHHECVFSAWRDCDNNAAFTAMMEADDEGPILLMKKLMQ